jgi:hypothetical protein
MFEAQDKYRQLRESAEDAVRPLLNWFKPLFQRLFKYRVRFYWFFFSLPSAVIVFLVNTRLFGELSGDYANASAFSSCLAVMAFMFSNYLRRRFTYVPSSQIKSLQEATKAAQVAHSLIEISGQCVPDDFWSKIMRVRPRDGIQLFRSRMEDAIKEIIKAHNPELVAGKHRLIDLIKYLEKEKLVAGEIVQLLKELREPVNRVVHGGEPAPELVEILEQNGMRLLLTLELRI